MGGTYDVNSRDFFSDENMNAIGEPATYADWAPGPNENTANLSLKPRPFGDQSQINYQDVERVELFEKGN